MRAPRTQGTAESNCELPDTTVPGERLEKASDVVGWHTSERTTIAFEYSEAKYNAVHFKTTETAIQCSN